MKIFVKDKDIPIKDCENCPLCEYFDRDAHGKGKHEVACLYEGTFNNILYGNQFNPKNCGIIKSLEQHNKEIRADERKKVVEEIEKWGIVTNDYIYYDGLLDYVIYSSLQNKLTEIKERK